MAIIKCSKCWKEHNLDKENTTKNIICDCWFEINITWKEDKEWWSDTIISIFTWIFIFVFIYIIWILLTKFTELDLNRLFVYFYYIFWFIFGWIAFLQFYKKDKYSWIWTVIILILSLLFISLISTGQSNKTLKSRDMVEDFINDFTPPQE